MSPVPGFAIRNSRTSPALFQDTANRRVVHQFLAESPEVYWNKGRSQAVIDRQISGAWICFGVFHGQGEDETLVGFARVVSDGERFAYLADVFILPEYRSKGLGKALVVAAFTQSADPASADDAVSSDSTKWKWLLFASGRAVDLYVGLGFQPSGVSYELAPGALKVE
ncbi:hypothetical protein FB45DRAFT_897228 [Roridomyces roridus]|uniref:N-acetyltransferase domain-containing protein n=1 Tax=Roridomyces roridus TaxID=1738132 RepID=A0AAD7FUT2_9AGAR|nr:hypothetical protein FB45DRAFT_897228 [Roridomyces roridus]